MLSAVYGMIFLKHLPVNYLRGSPAMESEMAGELAFLMQWQRLDVSGLLSGGICRQCAFAAANAPKNVNICRTFCAKITFMGENLLDKQTG